jgi:hypothetical protein
MTSSFAPHAAPEGPQSLTISTDPRNPFAETRSQQPVSRSRRPDGPRVADRSWPVKTGRPATFDPVVRAVDGGAGDQLADSLGRLGDDEVRALLLKAATDHDDVARALRLAATAPADRIESLKTEVDGALRTRRYLGYRESIDWAHDAAPVVDELAKQAVVAPSRELLALVERAIGHVVKVILKADDSSGTIGDLAHQLLEIHERVCDAGVADGVRLAKWMVRFGFDDQDFFTVDPVRYSAALGDDGLTAFRRTVAERSTAARVPFAVSYAEERLAVLDGDVDRVIELLGGDFTNTYHFIRVAEAMLELGRDDDALSWSQRGIESTTGWQVAQLYDIAADVLARRGDPDAVLDLRRDQHRRMPSTSSYALLRAVTPGKDWPAEQAAARDVLAARDRGALVDVMLADGDSDAAWQVATSDPDWEPGEHRWARLAEAREPTDPAAAMGVYLRLVESTLTKADKRAYRKATNDLKRARRAADPAGLSEEFDDYVAALREHHRRRPTLMAMLDKAGLR